jgi:hypothetical protein
VLVAAVVFGILAACGGETDSIEGDLAAASEIVEIPVSAAAPTGRDRYGFTNSNSEATIDVFEVEAALAARFDVFEAPRGEVIRFVRNPVSRGALAGVLEGSDSVVAILIPLLDPTRDFGVDFDAFFISLDASGSVIASDYTETTNARLDALFDFGRAEGLAPAEVLALTARAINADTLTNLESEAVGLLRGES